MEGYETMRITAGFRQVQKPYILRSAGLKRDSHKCSLFPCQMKPESGGQSCRRERAPTTKFLVDEK